MINFLFYFELVHVQNNETKISYCNYFILYDEHLFYFSNFMA